MKRLTILAILSAGAIGRAASPTTAPSDASDSQLVQQLGDPDYSVREKASELLLARGHEADDALRQAAASDDPQTQTLAKALLNRIANPPSPPVPGEAPAGLGRQYLNIHSEIDNGVVKKYITMNGRTVEIDNNPDGITMTVSGFTNGQPDTETYKAKDASDLKAKSPQAYALWQDLGGDSAGIRLGRAVGVGGPMININGGGNVIIGNIQPNVFAPPAPLPVAADSDDIPKLKTDVIQQMDHVGLPDAKREEVLAQIDQVQATRDAEKQAREAGTDNAEKLQNAYLNACDDLRRTLSANGLSDAGAVLPPPAWARLGVSVGPAPVPGGGIQVGSVETDSRGSRIGLQPMDIIRGINGTPMNSITDLRNAVMSSRQLTMTIMRNGQWMSLREHPATQPAQ